MKIAIRSWIASLCVATALATTAQAADAPPGDAAALAGRYELAGTREAASQLLLNADGSFEWMLSHGAVDQQAQGRWSATRERVVLEATSPEGSPTFRVFREDEMRLRKMPDAGTWVAIVGLPRVGPAAGVEVTFESRSGRRATAVTNEDGDAVVDMPARETWRRVGLRRIGDRGAPQWLAVPLVRATARVAAFAVDDPKWLVPAAFETLTLVRLGESLVHLEGQLVYRRR